MAQNSKKIYRKKPSDLRDSSPRSSSGSTQRSGQSPGYAQPHADHWICRLGCGDPTGPARPGAQIQRDLRCHAQIGPTTLFFIYRQFFFFFTASSQFGFLHTHSSSLKMGVAAHFVFQNGR
ncbi:Uncharacterized protein Fot_31315 [Forsythia ovata]|uniref:Uncharacterized protein n=1 Tax=Forsythia ovata TaxID=205694 RepID=A0ABD1T4S8_9LAMI